MDQNFDRMRQEAIRDLTGKGNGQGSPIFRLIESDPQNPRELVAALDRMCEDMPEVSAVAEKYRKLLASPEPAAA